VTAGEIYTMTVQVTNNSPAPALYTSLELLIAQGAVLVDAKGNEITGSSTVSSLGNIQPGQTVSQSFLVQSLVTGKIIACQAVASENIDLTVGTGSGSCNIANTIPVNFAFPPNNAPPTVMAISPLNNQSGIPITTSILATLTPQAGCLTADTWTNVETGSINPNAPTQGAQVISADLVNTGTFYLEEMDSFGNPVSHIPTSLTITPGVTGNTSIAVLSLGLSSPLSQYFLKPNTNYRATLVGGNNGVCNLNQASTTLPNSFQWTFSTAPSCSFMSSGLVYSRKTKLYSGSLTVTNTGTTTINGSLVATLNNLTTGVTLTNATGMNNGFPYIGSVVSLAPGASTTLPLQFSNLTNQPINYVPVTSLQ
jgi:hypothetical protein